ncbi:MAG: hypothetical protein ACLQVL_24330 [Terriglobia bacterium]
MNIIDFVLSVIHAFGNSVRGRTLLQKRCYFVAQILGKEAAYGFRPHFYGPYSPTVDDALNQLQGVGFVEESSIGFGAANSSGFEIRRHDYKLTSDGQEIAKFVESEKADTYAKVKATVRRIQDAGDPNYFELSIAAKAFYIIHSQKRPMTKGEIQKEAKRFGWQIEQQELNQAGAFLETLGLVAMNRPSDTQNT